MLQQNKGGPSLCGPVAQLGARFHGMEEVIGSIPIRSTKITSEESKSYSRQSLLGDTKIRTRKGHNQKISPFRREAKEKAHRG